MMYDHFIYFDYRKLNHGEIDKVQMFSANQEILLTL
jgi:hypothetical protein